MRPAPEGASALRLPSRTHRRLRRGLLTAAALALSAISTGEAAAQLPTPSVSGLGRVSPPVEIAGLEARPTPPMEFSRGWLSKAESVRRRRAELQAAGALDGMSTRELAAAGAALAGELRVPVIPIRYADVPAPFPVDRLVERFFGASRGDTVSYADYWREVSGGQLRVTGSVSSWVTLSRKAAHYLPAEQFGWARFGRMQEVRDEALRLVDDAYDFGEFDNDGPDGVPNSGDDDGYVDFVALVYALPCGSDPRAGAIWPHRGALAPFLTDDRSPSGRRIRVTDYIIQPAVEPQTCTPMQIGVLAHETGHAFGLPDLYDYDGSSQGIGAWGLMGTGSHNAPWSPAHPSAWEKEQLGWVTVSWLDEDGELEIRPVESDRVVYRYDLPDRPGEYLLLENRQRLGSDAMLPGTGLLVWKVDPERGELGAWNGDERWSAVGLLAADGAGDLARGSSADAADPFPGWKRRRTLALEESGLELAGIEEHDGVIRLRATITEQAGPALVASEREVGLLAVAGGASEEARLLVEGTEQALGWHAVGKERWLRTRQAGDTLFVRAEAGRLGPGVHADTLVLRATDAGIADDRVVVHLRVAAPTGTEVVASDLPWSWGLATSGGRVLQASYGWDPLGMRPRPRLLGLWDGHPQPLTLARLPAEAIYAPTPTADGGAYVLASAGGRGYLYRISPAGDAALVSAGLGVTRAYGTALLPDGTVLVADWEGRIRRVTPDGRIQDWVETRENFYQIAADSQGTVYAATYAGHVLRIDPQGRGSVLATGFQPGRLVAVAVGADGAVYAAERGGDGRVVRLRADGAPDVLARVENAEFYGLAAENGFLYAANLRHRQLLRIPIDPTRGVVATDRHGP